MQQRRHAAHANADTRRTHRRARSRARLVAVKDASASDLLKAVQHAASREAHGTLTVRERDVLQLAAQGHTNPEIAARLGISRRTAETHGADLMHKLALKGQKDLIRYALRRGILDL